MKFNFSLLNFSRTASRSLPLRGLLRGGCFAEAGSSDEAAGATPARMNKLIWAPPVWGAAAPQAPPPRVWAPPDRNHDISLRAAAGALCGARCYDRLLGPYPRQDRSPTLQRLVLDCFHWYVNLPPPTSPRFPTHPPHLEKSSRILVMILCDSTSC